MVTVTATWADGLISKELSALANAQAEMDKRRLEDKQEHILKQAAMKDEKDNRHQEALNKA